MKKHLLTMIMVILATPAIAAACPDFTGKYVGEISNSNYLHYVQITQSGCSVIAVSEWGVDGNTSSYEQSLAGATATLDQKSGAIRTSSGYFDYNNIYIATSEVNLQSQEWPGTTLEVFSKDPSGKLIISKLHGTRQYNELITFAGSKAPLTN